MAPFIIRPIDRTIKNGRQYERCNMGPVIPELQVPAVVTATISVNTSNVAAAQALVKFLQGPAIEPALERNGFKR